MTGKKFLFYFFLQWLALTLLKFWLFKYPFADYGLQILIFWAAVGVVSVAIIRRFGVINYLEALFLMVAWSIGDLFLDLAILSNFTGTSIFYKTEYWASFLVLNVGVFVFHKKRHLQVRKMLHDRDHGQKHGKH